MSLKIEGARQVLEGPPLLFLPTGPSTPTGNVNETLMSLTIRPADRKYSMATGSYVSAVIREFMPVGHHPLYQYVIAIRLIGSSTSDPKLVRQLMKQIYENSPALFILDVDQQIVTLPGRILNYDIKRGIAGLGHIKLLLESLTGVHVYVAVEWLTYITLLTNRSKVVEVVIYLGPINSNFRIWVPEESII